ncbi:GAD-like domain protein [Pseudomonas coronafaciens pv. atropurpurea]|uniref:GAD-like domain-containing protein n=1 Tax=Pseudomonas coronafaciens TaxID=53409 RepID=UPI0006D648B6|nr:GAD-like domain-containing protein [Pseudomonas coronafaciens]KPW35743.1 GAD-like domain protein [Pseudomonas coronafaciens pv. atropurpurea]RMT62606.1 GAD-like domain protein [Pseudomonas coronafaciens pv. atropurpurea]
MDRVFARFIEKLGAPIDRQEVPASSINRYQGKLPNLLLEYWAEHGWCGYGDGIFWLVNPQEYEGVAASWVEGTEFEKLDTYHIIARSAFGDLYFWGEKTGASLNITSILSRYIAFNSTLGLEHMDKQLQNFLLTRSKDNDDYGGLFEPAKKKIGVLRHNEMYGFVPALMLGGPDTLEHLEKVKAAEHLILLSQITELQPYSF